MNLPFEFSLSALEEEIVDDKLLEGRDGLEFLLVNITFDEADMKDYSKLAKSAGVYGHKEDFMEFVFDSMRLQPDDFHKIYPVNFWIARGMNLQSLSKEYNALKSSSKPFVMEWLIHKLGER